MLNNLRRSKPKRSWFGISREFSKVFEMKSVELKNDYLAYKQMNTEKVILVFEAYREQSVGKEGQIDLGPVPDGLDQQVERSFEPYDPRHPAVPRSRLFLMQWMEFDGFIQFVHFNSDDKTMFSKGVDYKCKRV
jgi:hypothetical protein